MRTEQADLGIAWDGDYDRCFFFDEHGQFIEGYYIVGLLAQNVPREVARRAHRSRPAAHLEHARHRRRGRRRSRAEQIRPRVHQAEDARGRRRLRRRDERAPLLPQVLVRRQRHDPVAADHGAHEPAQGVAVRRSSASACSASRERRDQPQGQGRASRRSQLRRGRVHAARARRRSTPTGSASSSPIGASTCARRTPSRCCA